MAGGLFCMMRVLYSLAVGSNRQLLNALYRELRVLGYTVYCIDPAVLCRTMPYYTDLPYWPSIHPQTWVCAAVLEACRLMSSPRQKGIDLSPLWEVRAAANTGCGSE